MGTFTVLQAPDGSTVQWYWRQEDTTPLPKFVTESPGERGFQVAGKYGTALSALQPRYAIRMETPVLYFYPDGPMDVKVLVDYKDGMVTESYPHAFREKTGVSWTGSLLPVNAEGLKLVPDASGPLGRHYAAARAVPEAWLFRRAVPVPAAVASPENPIVAAAGSDAAVKPLLPMAAYLKSQAAQSVAAQSLAASVVETDHFIFYRGAGNEVSRTIQVTTKDDHSFNLANNAAETVPVLFLLRVVDGMSVWRQVDDLKTNKIRATQDPNNPIVREGVQQVALPDAAEPLASSTPGLKAAMLAALEKEGLTKAEAAAMVATWDNLWFEEPGTRVLAVLPQAWVDAALPLQITPQPEVVERVFVARQELISVAQQNTLVNLLTKAEGDAAAARGELKKLALGRFSQGMLERAVAVKTREVSGQMRSRFVELSNPPAPVTPTEKAPPPVVGKAP